MSKTYTTVALLAEGVDRNPRDTTLKQLNAMSPSSRRAWIEISPASVYGKAPPVALLAEGVDRNFTGKRVREGAAGRPPRGGRG